MSSEQGDHSCHTGPHCSLCPLDSAWTTRPSPTVRCCPLCAVPRGLGSLLLPVTTTSCPPPSTAQPPSRNSPRTLLRFTQWPVHVSLHPPDAARQMTANTPPRQRCRRLLLCTHWCPPFTMQSSSFSAPFHHSDEAKIDSVTDCSDVTTSSTAKDELVMCYCTPPPSPCAPCYCLAWHLSLDISAAEASVRCHRRNPHGVALPPPPPTPYSFGNSLPCRIAAADFIGHVIKTPPPHSRRPTSSTLRTCPPLVRTRQQRRLHLRLLPPTRPGFLLHCSPPTCPPLVSRI